MLSLKSNMEEVKVYISDYSSLFNQFDKNDITDELATYIENRCSRLKNKEMVIKFISSNTISEGDKDKLVDAMRSHFGLEIKYNLIESKRRNLTNLVLMLVGLLILIFKNILPLLNTLFDILDIFACFIIWESAYNLLFTDNESDVKIARAKKISNAKIEFIID